MDLQEDEIQEFIRLWSEEYGEMLSAGEARQQASLLLELYGVLADPLPEDRHESSGGQKQNASLQCDTSSTAENPAKTRIAKSSP